VMNTTGLYPRLKVDTTTSGAVGQAGGVLLTETIAASGVGRELSAALSRWRRPLAIHDPAKVITDLAVTLALGGDCMADIALLRAEPGVYGLVASDATVSRTIDALAQLPGHRHGTRPGRKVLIRIDGAGSTHAVLDWMTAQRLSYSVGFSLPSNTADPLKHIPDHVWAPALDAHDKIRDGAWVAELTDLLNLSGWPKGMRVIVRKERPHPGAQLTITDIDGHRITAFATNTKTGGPSTQLADLEIRHRRRARCEDRIRNAKDTGLRAFPLFDFTQNQIWCAIVALAVEITAWMQMLALTDHPARRWEPKRLRLRLFTVPVTLARTGRRILLHLAAKAPWAELAGLGITRMRALVATGGPSHRVPPTPERSPAPGTGAHPRRHSGHCHTQMPKSPRQDGAAAVTTEHRRPPQARG